MKKLSQVYYKKYSIAFEIYPFNRNKSREIIEPYNAVLSTHFSSDNQHLMSADNENTKSELDFM